MVKHIQAIRRQQSKNCLSVFEHFVGVALKGLILEVKFGNDSQVRTRLDEISF